MRNMHNVDRAVRAVLGIALIWISAIDGTFIASFWVSALVLIFGIVNIISVVIAFCPLYYLAGFNFAPRVQDE